MTKETDVVMIPDGDFLRKYIGLFEEILHHFSHGTESMTLILLESAAEAMDHRNNSPSIRTSSTSGPSHCMESASVNERNRILKLWQEFKAEESSGGISVIPFPDLTYRNHDDDDDVDDFDLFKYEDMCIKDRSR
eukprot:CAMPEP_0194118136 /NCGR_PEP_ID=MMETSP0150-20130528/34256_1 /TAXON_ID=122233 /ORGANISM="Chaetoceros debilis, Strain MM31A-1" /LENGTH=134 /DNA_ID=CAMNT_0038809415 /DNA_START=111 /DNA_END=511 /DNA_ORIENTATION=-